MKKATILLVAIFTTIIAFGQTDTSSVVPQKTFTITVNEQQAQTLLFVLNNGKLDGMTNADGTIRALLVQDITRQLIIQSQSPASAAPPKKEKPKK